MKTSSPFALAVFLTLGVVHPGSHLVRAADYPAAVLAEGPAAYFRLGDTPGRTTVNVNAGSLGAPGNASQNLGRVHTIPGAVAGDSGRAAFFDFTSRTEIPWNAALNPANDKPFTIEAWFYPMSDQTATGQSPISNRYAYSGVNRQGWVFFQRKPSEEYAGNEPVGWNFRMFRGSGGSSGLDVTSRVPYEIGKWTHVVVAYDPANIVDASVTMYIDGVEAAKTTWAGGPDGTSPGYVANTNDHDPSVAVAGPAGLAIGNYNNTALTSLNPYFGGIDEFAFYPTRLTPEQILSHYQNATNINRTIAYADLVKSHSPTVYLPLDEEAPGDPVAVNFGETRSAGHGTHSAEVRTPVAGVLPAQPANGAVSYHNRNGRAVTTLPFHARNNPPAGEPFSFEMWVRPLRDQQGGQCPANNRWVGGTGRTGWVIFQRNPNLTYPASEGHGWVFRMFRGAGNSGSDVMTETDYTVGEWQHLAFTWQPEVDNGDPGGNGNNQWQGILSAYVNGVLVKSNPSALYAANREVPEDEGVPADLGIGAYNAKSGLGDNPFEGDIDEVAIYNNHLLTPEQVLAHYQAGTNARPATSYETQVMTASFTGPERQGPATYLRFADSPRLSLANSAVGASPAVAVLANASANGPRPPAFLGFEADNRALALAATEKSWAALQPAAALAATDRLTLSAWVQPGALDFTLGPAHIVSRGPLTPSSFISRIVNDGMEILAANTNTAAVSMRLEQVDGVAQYVVGTFQTTAGSDPVEHTARFNVPAADLAGGQWVQLTGVFDGTQWRLYRNGVEVASAAGSVAALGAVRGDWAIGAAGNGWEGLFTGAIDEVALYPKALAADRVQALFNTAVSGAVVTPLSLAINQSGASVILTWSRGTLQQSATLNGPFVDVPGARSPYTVTPGDGSQKYRLR